MHTAHHIVTVEHAKAGMVLSDDILDQQGQVLLAGGTVLTDATILALGRHDVDTIPILLVGDMAPPADNGAIVKRLAYLFRGHGVASSAAPATVPHAAPHPTADTAPAGTANAILHRYIEDYRLGREAVP